MARKSKKFFTAIIVTLAVIFVIAGGVYVADKSSEQSFLNYAVGAESYTNKHIAHADSAFTGDWCLTSRDSQSAGWSTGVPCKLNDNYMQPCCRYECSGNNIIVKEDPRTFPYNGWWAHTCGKFAYWSSPIWEGKDYVGGNQEIICSADMPSTGIIKSCEYGCITEGDTVSCKTDVVPPNPEEDSTGINFYQNYNKTFTVDFADLVVKSCNNPINWQSLSCDYVYYCYAVLPSRDATLDQSIQKDCAEVSLNVPQTATIGVVPFTPPASASEWVLTHFVTLQRMNFVNGNWIENITIPPEYINAEDIYGNYVPAPTKLETSGIFGKIAQIFVQLWEMIRSLLGL